MIEQFLKRPLVRQSLERSSLASVVKAFVGHLDGRGYGKHTVHAYLEAAAHFGRWLHRQRPGLAQANEKSVDFFLTRHLPHCRCPPPRNRTTHIVRAAVHQLVVVLRASGAVPPVAPSPSPAASLLASFELHLTQACGLAPATVHSSMRVARELLVARFGSDPVEPKALTPTDVRDFVTARAAVLSPASTNSIGRFGNSQLSAVPGSTRVRA